MIDAEEILRGALASLYLCHLFEHCADSGCVAVAETEQEVLEMIHDAMEFHLEGLREDGEVIPIPRSAVEYVEVAAA